MSQKIIHRDMPLRAGQTIQLCVETYYTIEIDDWLGGEQSVTVDDIERGLGGEYLSGRMIAEAAFGGDVGKREIGEVVFVMDVPSREFGTLMARFETSYEAGRGRVPYGCEYVALPQWAS